MRATDFSFELPESLTTHRPMPERSSCRLLSLDGPTGMLMHGILTDLLDKLSPGDLLVSNNIRVISARLFGRKTSDGRIEVLVERMLDNKRILACIRASKAPEPDAELLLGDNESINATVTAYHGALLKVEFSDERSVLGILSSIDHMSLSPYIDRSDEDAGRKLRQTVYNEKPGVVVVPAAGLRSDEPLPEELRAKGVEMAFVTLHVGAGTFQSVRADTIEDRTMYSKCAEVPQDVIDVVLAAGTCGNRVIAVGTTSVHPLENAAQTAKNDLTKPSFDDIQIFIYPDFQYRVVDTLVTSSHLPESTLIILVSASTGYQHTMNVYKATVEEKYRSFSYGDVIFITYNPQVINERVRE